MVPVATQERVHRGLGASEKLIKIARRNTNNLRYADDTTLMADSEVGTSTTVVIDGEKWVYQGCVLEVGLMELDNR